MRFGLGLEDKVDFRQEKREGCYGIIKALEILFVTAQCLEETHASSEVCKLQDVHR